MELALYRACRPRRFDEFVGQEHVTRTLRNALAQGRLAHAYLFCGPRGTGKTSAARVLAKAVSCPNAQDGNPCGQCEACIRIGAGEGVDVIEMDAASNRGIDEIRSLRERIRLAPVAGRYKVYVIDEVHMLTNEAFNALLKTLEEPPGNVLFVLCTTEAYRVPATILSRCQRFDFHRLTVEQIAGHLAAIASDRQIKADEDALRMIARAATGSVRDALGILDQCVAYAPQGVRVDDVRRVLGTVDGAALVALADGILCGDVGASWRELDDLLAQGRDSREVTRALTTHFRDLLLYALAGQRGEFAGPAADDAGALCRQAETAGEAFLHLAIESLAAVEAEMRIAPQPRLLLEARLVRLCSHCDRRAAPSLPQALAAVPEQEAPAAPRASNIASRARSAQAMDEMGSLPKVDAGSPRELVREPEPAQAQTQAQADPAPAPRDESQSLPRLERLWNEVLARVNDIEAGWLTGAEPEWDGAVLRVRLPSGGEVAAARLSGGDGRLNIAQIASDLTGRPVEVVIEVRKPAEGLFQGELGPPGERRTRSRASGGSSGSRSPTGPPTQVSAGEAGQSGGSGSSLTRHAEVIFRAEEVKGGPTEK